MGKVMSKSEKQQPRPSRIIEAARQEGVITADQLLREETGEPQCVDPFEKAKAIRRGELDHEMPMHDELTGWISRMPRTWLGSVLRAVVARMAKEPFFKDDETLHRYIDNCLAAARDPYSMLRQPLPPAPEQPGSP